MSTRTQAWSPPSPRGAPPTDRLIVEARTTGGTLEEAYLELVGADRRGPGGRVVSAPASRAAATGAQVSMELRLTARRGENVLVTVIIPAVVLVFFSSMKLVPATAGDPLAFLVPGALALAIIATSLVNLGIATAYERNYGVLKRLGGSPLTRSGPDDGQGRHGPRGGGPADRAARGDRRRARVAAGTWRIGGDIRRGVAARDASRSPGWAC